MTSIGRAIELFKKFGRKCIYCGDPLNVINVSVDHFIPKSKNGWLKVPACKFCNALKGNMLPDEFIQNIDIMKEKLDKIKENNRVEEILNNKTYRLKF